MEQGGAGKLGELGPPAAPVGLGRGCILEGPRTRGRLLQAGEGEQRVARLPRRGLPSPPPGALPAQGSHPRLPPLLPGQAGCFFITGATREACTRPHASHRNAQGNGEHHLHVTDGKTEAGKTDRQWEDTSAQNSPPRGHLRWTLTNVDARACVTTRVLPPTPNPEASSCQPSRRGNHCAKHQLCAHRVVRPKVDAERTPGIASVLQKQAHVKERSRVLRAGNPRTALGLLAPGGPDAASLTPGSWKDSTQDPEDGGGPSRAGAEKPAGWTWGGASSRLRFPASEASFSIHGLC